MKCKSILECKTCYIKPRKFGGPAACTIHLQQMPPLMFHSSPTAGPKWRVRWLFRKGGSMSIMGETLSSLYILKAWYT